MNERIRLLANQANDLANRELEQLEAADGRVRDLTEYKKRYTEYLVDLVVRECMSLCTDVEEDVELTDYVGSFRDGALMCREDIKKHFGVEL